MEIPKSFQVGGQLINIKLVPQCDNNNLGDTCVAKGEINIAETFKIDKEVIYTSKTSQLCTLWHEVTHSILDTMGETKLSENEKFVNTFSGFLNEIILSMNLKDCFK